MCRLTVVFYKIPFITFKNTIGITGQHQLTMTNFSTKTIKNIQHFLLIVISLNFFACTNSNNNSIVENTDIVIENAEMQLTFGNNGSAKSLIHKATGQECLMQNVNLPAFSITQDMPYDNEIKLTYPAKSKTFEADSLYREGDNLIVSFELTDYEAVVNLNITDDYIGFTLEGMRYKMAAIGDKRKTRIDEFVFLQIPIKDRTHFNVGQQCCGEFIGYRPVLPD